VEAANMLGELVVWMACEMRSLLAADYRDEHIEAAALVVNEMYGTHIEKMMTICLKLPGSRY
jgi:hypothetical protein